MKITKETEQDMLPEYDFDYSKAKMNRFAFSVIVGINKRIKRWINLRPD
jgi:hypothetical protein